MCVSWFLVDDGWWFSLISLVLNTVIGCHQWTFARERPSGPSPPPPQPGIFKSMKNPWENVLLWGDFPREKLIFYRGTEMVRVSQPMFEDGSRLFSQKSEVAIGADGPKTPDFAITRSVELMVTGPTIGFHSCSIDLEVSWNRDTPSHHPFIVGISFINRRNLHLNPQDLLLGWSVWRWEAAALHLMKSSLTVVGGFFSSNQFMRKMSSSFNKWGLSHDGVPPVVIIHFNEGFPELNHLFWGSPLIFIYGTPQNWAFRTWGYFAKSSHRKYHCNTLKNKRGDDWGSPTP